MIEVASWFVAREACRAIRNGCGSSDIRGSTRGALKFLPFVTSP